MNTPICDFVRRYAADDPIRMHMPGHKGKAALGPEALDLTEIEGADELYRSRGIIRESEENAAGLFGVARTLYSAEGSSLCIRAMLYLAALHARENRLPLRLLAGRNAHKTVMTAAALLDLEIDWMRGGAEDGLLSCDVTPQELERRLREKPYMAVWLTSPDYLGRRADLRGAAAMCRRYGVPLLVDNAHGAYLKFCAPDEHPLTLGADACCDSAHKTLPCLTGAAYLHLSARAPKGWAEQAEQAMALFASTSPSWLILQSLDRLNPLLEESYPARLRSSVLKTAEIKNSLARQGWTLVGNEPMKITLKASEAGYPGEELSRLLRREGIECEYADRDFVVLMPSAETAEDEWRRTLSALRSLPRREAVPGVAPRLPVAERALSIREAMLSPSEEMPVEKAVGEILADAAVGCPPAVPVVIAGEKITAEAAACMRYYGIESCRVVRRP